MELKCQTQSLLSPSWRNAWEVWWHSEYGLARFHAYLPPDKPKHEQFKVGLSLRDWKWKLTGIGLPDHLRVQLAQELVRQNKRFSEAGFRLQVQFVCGSWAADNTARVSTA